MKKAPIFSLVTTAIMAGAFFIPHAALADSAPFTVQANGSSTIYVSPSLDVHQKVRANAEIHFWQGVYPATTTDLGGLFCGGACNTTNVDDFIQIVIPYKIDDHTYSFNAESQFGYLGDGSYWIAFLFPNLDSGGMTWYYYNFVRTGGVWAGGATTDTGSRVISVSQPALYSTTTSPVPITYTYVLDGHDPITGLGITAKRQTTLETKTFYQDLPDTSVGTHVATTSVYLTGDGTYTLSLDLNDYSSSVPGSPTHFVNRPASTVFGLNSNDNVTTVTFGAAYQTQYASSSCQVNFTGSFSLSDCFGYLFVPGTNVFSAYTVLPSQLSTRFPFSYLSSIQNTWAGLTASSTANSPTYQFELHDLGIGSTTALGNILPNATVFSASTTKQYFPPGIFDLLKSLAAVAIWLGFFADVFFTIRNMIRT